MNFKTINTILYCNKWEETVSFYETQLSLEATMQLDWFVEFRLNENSRLSVADAKRASIESSGGEGITISMEVNDINATYNFLKDKGLRPTEISDHPWGAKVIYICDPEGNRLEFWSGNEAGN